MNFDSWYPNFVTKNNIQQKFVCGLHILFIGIESKHSLLSVHVFLQGINDIMNFFQEFLIISSKTSAYGHNIKSQLEKNNSSSTLFFDQLRSILKSRDQSEHNSPRKPNKLMWRRKYFALNKQCYSACSLKGKNCLQSIFF